MKSFSVIASKVKDRRRIIYFRDVPRLFNSAHANVECRMYASTILRKQMNIPLLINEEYCT